MAEMIIEPDFSSVGQRLAQMLQILANEADDTDDFFKIGLSGDYYFLKNSLQIAHLFPFKSKFCIFT